MNLVSQHAMVNMPSRINVDQCSSNYGGQQAASTAGGLSNAMSRHVQPIAAGYMINDQNNIMINSEYSMLDPRTTQITRVVR